MFPSNKAIYSVCCVWWAGGQGTHTEPDRDPTKKYFHYWPALNTGFGGESSCSRGYRLLYKITTCHLPCKNPPLSVPPLPDGDGIKDEVGLSHLANHRTRECCILMMSLGDAMDVQGKPRVWWFVLILIFLHSDNFI